MTAVPGSGEFIVGPVATKAVVPAPVRRGRRCGRVVSVLRAVPDGAVADLVFDGDGGVVLPAGVQLGDAMVQGFGAVGGGDLRDADAAPTAWWLVHVVPLDSGAPKSERRRRRGSGCELP